MIGPHKRVRPPLIGQSHQPPFWLLLQHTGIFSSATTAKASYNEGEKTVHSCDNTSDTCFVFTYPYFLLSWLLNWMTKTFNVILLGNRLCSHTDSGDRPSGQRRPCRGQEGPQGEQNTDQWPLILKSRISQDLFESQFTHLWLWNMWVYQCNEHFNPQVTHKVWFDITIGGEAAGRIEIGLFGKTVPKVWDETLPIWPKLYRSLISRLSRIS